MREGAGQIPEELAKFRRWFQAATEHSREWQTEAKEDYNFVCGKQWSEEELKTFEKQKRPALVINRIAPLINIVTGYQKLNRYDIDFLGRTSDDVELAQVRKGVTKYILDRCEFENIESQTFTDMSIGGIGVFGVKYSFDHEANDGEAKIEHVDPFSMYVDPEAHELDYSDAKYIFRARWIDKDELKNIYSDKADIIEETFSLYDRAEEDNQEVKYIDPEWYNSELRKIRVVECWYKVNEKRQMAYLNNGQALPIDDKSILQQLVMQGLITDQNQIREIPVTKVRCCTFFDRTLLEDIDSPYQHGEFPYVFCIFKYYGVGDIPAGFVRALKDPQRELNKRRIQELHLLNSSGNGGSFMEEDAMSPEQEAEYELMGNVPGHVQKVRAGALQQNKIRERQPVNPPTAIINAEQQATNDLTTISGINEQLLGTNIPNSASGRAIELRQKQAVAHLAVCFDALRRAKKRIAYLLWGKQGKAGIVPQFYTAEKTYRIEGVNGQEWITVNQQIVQQDPTAGIIVKTLNDLSIGDFDIVVADVESSTTQRQAQLWSLIDGVSKLGIPSDLIFDTIIDLSDLPKKNEIIQKYQQRLEQQQMQQQQQAQAQMEIERIKNENLNQSITFKDAILPVQLAMCAKQGLIDPQIANYFMQMWIQQTAPQLAMQMAQAQQQQAMMMMNQTQPQQVPQQPQQLPLTPEMMFNQQPQNQAQPMTQAAAQSVMNNMTPAM